MAFRITFTKIINTENFKIVIKKSLKTNYYFNFLINMFLLKYVILIYSF